MTLAFRAACNSTQKLVLLALCDSANDQGECYPSVGALTLKCSLSERAIRKALAELEASGHMRREMRVGRSTTYWMTPAPRAPQGGTTCTPAPRAPLHHVHPTPAPRAPRGGHDVHPGGAPRAPITINEPSIEPSGKQKTTRASALPPSVSVDVLTAAGIDADTAAEFIAHKARVKAPLTARAWADHQREAAKAGWSPLQAAEKVLAKSWRGFEAKYVADERPPPGSGQPRTAFERKAAETSKWIRGTSLDPSTHKQPEYVDAVALAIRP
jgi:hypothetical protein